MYWRCSNPSWTWSSTTFFSWPCFEQEGLGRDDLRRSLTTSVVLWFSGEKKSCSV